MQTTKIPPSRQKEIIVEVLEFTRKEFAKTMPNSDWKDIDDNLFSELNITKSELHAIYADTDCMIYDASCVDDKPETKNEPATYRRFIVKNNDPAEVRKAEQILRDHGLGRYEIIQILKCFELNPNLQYRRQ